MYFKVNYCKDLYTFECIGACVCMCVRDIEKEVGRREDAGYSQEVDVRRFGLSFVMEVGMIFLGWSVFLVLNIVIQNQR